MGSPTVISVRLSAEEHARLQQAADAMHLPVSTTIRVLALDRLRTRDSAAAVDERLARLEAAVFTRSA